MQNDFGGVNSWSQLFAIAIGQEKYVVLSPNLGTTGNRTASGSLYNALLETNIRSLPTLRGKNSVDKFFTIYISRDSIKTLGKTALTIGSIPLPST